MSNAPIGPCQPWQIAAYFTGATLLMALVLAIAFLFFYR